MTTIFKKKTNCDPPQEAAATEGPLGLAPFAEPGPRASPDRLGLGESEDDGGSPGGLGTPPPPYPFPPLGEGASPAFTIGPLSGAAGPLGRPASFRVPKIGEGPEEVEIPPLPPRPPSSVIFEESSVEEEEEAAETEKPEEKEEGSSPPGSFTMVEREPEVDPASPSPEASAFGSEAEEEEGEEEEGEGAGAETARGSGAQIGRTAEGTSRRPRKRKLDR